MFLKKQNKKLKEIVKSKKGLSSIELVFGALVCIVVFAGYLDFILISNRMQAMSTSMTYLTRTISNQGCLSNNPESNCLINNKTGYVKDYIKNKKFVTSQELYNEVKSIMDNEKIPTSDWKVLINGSQLTSSTQTKLFNFREEIEIDIKIKYKWSNLSQLLPINIPDKEFTSNQTTLSLYKFRDKGSDSGFQYGT